MTWLVTLTARDQCTGEERDHTVRLAGDDVDDLLYPRYAEFKWKHLASMLERGSLRRVKIDYRASKGPSDG
jgi:UDP-galactopyranose mutase